MIRYIVRSFLLISWQTFEFLGRDYKLNHVKSCTMSSLHFMKPFIVPIYTTEFN